MKFLLEILPLCLAFCGYFALGQTTEKPQQSKNKYLYNATTSFLNLEGNKPMVLIVNALSKDKLGDALGSIQLPEASQASVSGSSKNSTGGRTFTMSIDYASPIEGKGMQASKVTLDFEMVLDQKTLYWKLTSLDVSIVGKLLNCTSDCDLNLKNAMNVAPRPGFTSRPEDLNCQRGYSICAPSDLCWTCSDQDLLPKVSNNSVETRAASIIIYGMQLQPVTSSKPFKEFGYRYDCDPIWSSALWSSLLLSLFLIVILAWAIDMLVTLNGPSKFDDPKGKPLVVPLND